MYPNKTFHDHAHYSSSEFAIWCKETDSALSWSWLSCLWPLTLPHTVTPSMAGAAEQRSPGRQMNLQGDSRSTMDGAFGEKVFFGVLHETFRNESG